MRKRTLVTGLALAAAISTTGASAGDLTAFYSWSEVGSANVVYYGNNESPNTGKVIGSKVSGSEAIIKNPGGFLSFCIELGQPLNIGQNNYHSDVDILVSGIITKPNPGPQAVTFNQSQVDQLGRLWYAYVPTLSSVNDYKAMQIAVWEIAFDGGTNNLGAGNFQYTGGLAATVSGMLTTANGNGLKSTLAILRDDSKQDLITEAVPEPFTMALGASALGLAIARRRRANRA